MKTSFSFLIKRMPLFSRILKADSGLNNVAKNMGWLLFERVLRLSIGLTVGIWVARYLQPERFGMLSYAIAFSALISPLAKLGLDAIVVRELVNHPEQTDSILGTGFVLKLVGGLLVVIFACFFQFLLDANDRQTLLLVAIIASSTVFQAFDVIDLWFQSQVRSKYAVVARNVGYVLYALFRIALILCGAGLLWFAVAEFSNFLLGGIVLAAAYLIYGKRRPAWRFDPVQGHSLLRESWPLIVQGLVIMMYMRVDQIMLKSMMGAQEVGIYSVSVRLTEFWYFIPMMLTQSLFPAIIRSKHLGEKTYLNRIQHLYTLLIWMSISMAIFVSIFSDDIVHILFGESYGKAGPILALHIWLGCSVYFGVARQKWIIAEKKLKTIMSLNLVGCLMNVLANFLLIPIYGPIGSAAASLMAAIGANLLMAIFSPTIRFSLKMYGASLLFPLVFLWTTCTKSGEKG